MAITFEKSARDFLDHLQIERGLALNSISAYSRDLGKFSQFLQDKALDFTSLQPQDILDFEVNLKARELSPSSINRTISALRSFYKYASREGSVNDPTGETERSRLSRRLPKALTISQITAMIDSALHEGDLTSLRDHAILELLYSSGARVSEVVTANLRDLGVITVEGNEVATIKVKGKGSKERIVPLGSFARTALDNYLVRTRPGLSEKVKARADDAPLFLNSRGGRLTRQSIWQIVSDAAIATGLTGKISPHVFRHSYATHLLDGGADIRVVQELLGHASVTTTQIYTLVTIDKVREAYSTAHPRAR
jgi:integrase/recombinase XerD